MPFIRPNPNAKSNNKIMSGVTLWAQAEKMMQIALLLPSAAVIGWLAGAWADMHLHTKWIGLAGIVFGGISGLVYVVRLAVAAANDSGGSAKTGNETGKGKTGIEP
jgi:F0F1-type ATP synthase assembly protein I